MVEELTLAGELDRQLKSVRKGESETIVCPWCGVISNSGSDECCIEFATAKDELGKLHLKQVIARFKSVRNGLADSVQCPYCDEINRWENHESPAHWKRPNVNIYCCDAMAYAVVVVGENAITQDQIDHMRRIEDNLAKVSMN